MKIAIILLFLGCTNFTRADDDDVVTLVKSYIDAGIMRNGEFRNDLRISIHFKRGAFVATFGGNQTPIYRVQCSFLILFEQLDIVSNLSVA